MPDSNVLIYLLRRDLRVTDNRVLHYLATHQETHGFTHLLPLYVFSARQIEISGFIPASSSLKNPYPEAKSKVGGYWRCGPHRAKFIAECVQDLQQSLESLGSGLVIRVGMPAHVIEHFVLGLKSDGHRVGAVWMFSEDGAEEEQDESDLAALCSANDVEFKLWPDEKHFVDDNDLPFSNINELPDAFTTYRKMCEPLRERPKPSLPAPGPASLPPFLQPPPQQLPFVIPDDQESLKAALLAPVQSVVSDISAQYEAHFARMPDSGSPPMISELRGGEHEGCQRLLDLFAVKNAKLVSDYNTNRNGLFGFGYSSRLSAYLSQGCLTARMVHEALLQYEGGLDDTMAAAKGFGLGENSGSLALRTELLWRDFMRLNGRRFQDALFHLHGFRSKRGGDVVYQNHKEKKGSDNETAEPQILKPCREHFTWLTAEENENTIYQTPSPKEVGHMLQRLQNGTTGLGLIDASQRELLHTGFTSSRARTNVSCLWAKHLNIDWRYGAEWYEMLLVDYDVCSNWANWQYAAGVGNDPRGTERVFNPVKQAFDYDPEGEYVRAWLPEVAGLTKLEHVFQPVSAPANVLALAGLEGHPMVVDPVKRFVYAAHHKPSSQKENRDSEGMFRGRMQASVGRGPLAPYGSPPSSLESLPNTVESPPQSCPWSPPPSQWSPQTALDTSQILSWGYQTSFHYEYASYSPVYQQTYYYAQGHPVPPGYMQSPVMSPINPPMGGYFPPQGAFPASSMFQAPSPAYFAPGVAIPQEAFNPLQQQPQVVPQPTEPPTSQAPQYTT